MINKSYNSILFFFGLFFLIAFFGVPKISLAATYYLDAVNGNDSNSGNISEPWQTLAKAQVTTVSGDMVYLKTGDYGTYTESNYPARTDYITYHAMENEMVHFDTININNSALTDSYLIFQGINIKPDWVDPCTGGQMGCDDPQYPESTQSTYSKTAQIVSITNSRAVKIIDSKLEGQLKYLTSYGVTIASSEDIVIDHCEITKVERGVNMMTESSNIKILNNHIHGIGASAIVQGNSTCSNILIEGNYAHDSYWSALDDYSPKAPNQNYHGSGIALRNGNVILRNNIIHDGFPSAGIMCYNTDTAIIPQYDNITIENNLVYDINTPYVMRFYLLGDNVNVRNNTFVGYLRTGGGEYRYNTALAVHSLATDGAPHLNMSNNIFLGASYFNSIYTSQNNNIFYSWSDGTFQCVATNNSLILACDYSDNASDEVAQLFSCGANCNFNANHKEWVDYTLGSSSPAINFGDVNTQSIDSLGVVADNYLIANGLARSSTRHSAGAYEYMDIIFPSAPLRLTVL